MQIEMKNSKTILQESLRTPMLEQSIKLPYAVPEGYFDSLATTLLAYLPKDKVLIKNTSFPTFSLPEGYFEGLSDSILARVSVLSNDLGDELYSTIPVLKTISNQLPYQVPEGYFENHAIKSQSTEQPQVARVVSIRSMRIWLRMAVAASVVGIILLAATNLYHKDNSNSYASYKSVDLNKSVNNLSDDDLIKYLDNDYIASNTETIILDDGAAPSIEQDAQDVTDKDLTQYLKESSKHKRHKKGI